MTEKNKNKIETQAAMSESDEHITKSDISIDKTAEAVFTKMPTLGLVAWLYARTQERRFLFLADLDWAIMPPLVMNQCRLFMKGKIPFAFITWAFVSEHVNQRLLAGQAKLAPQEWKSGPHLWLIDVVTPFGGVTEILTDLHHAQFANQPSLRYLGLNPKTHIVEIITFKAPTSASSQSGKNISAAQMMPPSSQKH